MTNDEIKKYVEKLLPDSTVRCWCVTNELLDEKPVYSVEQESLDFMKDLMTDAYFKAGETKRTEGVFVTYENLIKLIANHKEEVGE